MPAGIIVVAIRSAAGTSPVIARMKARAPRAAVALLEQGRELLEREGLLSRNAERQRIAPDGFVIGGIA